MEKEIRPIPSGYAETVHEAAMVDEHNARQTMNRPARTTAVLLAMHKALLELTDAIPAQDRPAALYDALEGLTEQMRHLVALDRERS